MLLDTVLKEYLFKHLILEKRQKEREVNFANVKHCYI